MAAAKSDSDGLAPPDVRKCIFCQRDASPGAGLFILSCLHRTCGGCLDEHVEFQSGSVLCPQCQQSTSPSPQGQHLHCVLPKISTHPPRKESISNGPVPGLYESGSAKAAAVVLCDMCEEDGAQEAVKCCQDCSWVLCLEHAHQHTNMRPFRGHHIVGLEESSARLGHNAKANGTVPCQIHPSLPLSSYCTSCNVLLCERCKQAHIEPTYGCDMKLFEVHCVMPLQQAYEQAKEALTAVFSTSADAGIEAVASKETTVNSCGSAEDSQARLEQISSAISHLEDEGTDLDEEVDKVSREVEEYCATLWEDIQKRQTQLLDELDKIRWRRSQQLDQQRATLQHCLDTWQMATELSSANSIDRMNMVDVLRLHPFLKKSSELSERIIKNKQHVVWSGCRPVFHVETAVSMAAHISTFGEVQDCGIDVCKSKLYACQYASQGEQIHLGIDARDSQNKPIRFALGGDTISVVVCPPHDTLLPQKREKCSYDSSRKIISMADTVKHDGDYVVKVMAGKRHFLGSPVMLQVGGAPLRFDRQAMAQRRLVLNEDCMQVRHVEEKGNAVVLGNLAFQGFDQPTWTVQINGLNAQNYMFLGVTTLPLPKNTGDYEVGRCQQTTHGWTSTGRGYSLHIAAASAQMSPWQDGHVLRFRLMCRSGSLEVENKTTGESAALKGIYNPMACASPLYFFTYLYSGSHSVQLLNE